MTDTTGLPPEQEAVRRLLADARHDGPTPPEVVARLDAALASLTAERGETSSVETRAPAVDLGARRRRMAGVGLLAAAAVVVAGVAIGQVLPPMQGGSDAGSAAGGDSTTSQHDLSDDDGAGSGSDAGGATESEETGPQSLKSGSPAPLEAYPTISSDDDDLDDDLLALRASSQAPASATLTPDPRGTCDLRGTGRGRRVLAEVDGEVGAVVFRRPDGARQQVDLYLCGGPTAVRTLTLPAP